MRRSEWKRSLRNDRAGNGSLFLVVLLLCLFAISFAGCVTVKRERPEPEWHPEIYSYRPIDSRCRFYRAASRVEMFCDEPEMKGMALVPILNINAVYSKFDRCVEWK